MPPNAHRQWFDWHYSGHFTRMLIYCRHFVDMASSDAATSHCHRQAHPRTEQTGTQSVNGRSSPVMRRMEPGMCGAQLFPSRFPGKITVHACPSGDYQHSTSADRRNPLLTVRHRNSPAISSSRPRGSAYARIRRTRMQHADDDRIKVEETAASRARGPRTRYWVR